MFTKSHIIAEIQRTAKENGGSPLGIARFEAETGVKRADWIGKLWVRWGDALEEAGFDPNVLQGPRNEGELLERLAVFSRELGRFPVTNEIKMKAKVDPGFPWHSTLTNRFGSMRNLAAKLREFAQERSYPDVMAFCDAIVAQPHKCKADISEDAGTGAGAELGYVYLLKSGQFYKIGRSNAVGRRERELAIQLPEEAKIVHSIKTDDPVGIERYWHGRFSTRRKNGEWFELTTQDVSSFRRRKFM